MATAEVWCCLGDGQRDLERREGSHSKEGGGGGGGRGN